MSSRRPAPPARPRPAARTWIFRLVLAFGAPVLFLLLLEGALRVAGFGQDTAFFIPDAAPGFYRSNPRFTARYFPESFGLKPVNFRLPRAKPAGSFRLFVLGESAAMGVPEPAFGLAPQLQAQLRGVHPGAALDVYNLGVTAINSHAILPLLREALGFHPDLLVIYMGNNEVVGPYGLPPLPLPLVRLALAVRASRTGQLMQRLAEKAGRAAAPDWRGMETFPHKTLPASDPRLARIRANFAANLDAMLAAAKAAGVKVVLSTVAVNVRDCAPFVSEPGATPAWAEAMAAGRRAADAANWPAARDAFAAAVRADPAPASSHYELAAALDRLGEAGGARREYGSALEEDALRFRADPALNAIVRAAAASAGGGVTLVDAARELGADPASTAPPSGRDLFLEHVHLTWEGNYALTRLLAPAADEALFGAFAAPRPWLDVTACADAVGFTALGRLAMLQGMDKLTGRPPFTGQSRFALDRARLARDTTAAVAAVSAEGALPAAVATLDATLRRDPGNALLLNQAALAALQRGDATGALALLDRLDAAQPFGPESAVARTLALRRLGRGAEAEPVLLRAIAAEPYYFQTYNLLAQLWVDAGRTAEARTYFAAAVARLPDARLLRLTYAQVLASAGEWPAAEEQWRAALKSAPDDEVALDPLLRRFMGTNRAADAVALMTAAFAANPRSLANNRRLVEYAAARGDETALAGYFGALVDSGPVPAALYRDVAARIHAEAPRRELAAALARGRAVAAASGDQAAVAEIDRLLREPWVGA